MFFHPETDKIYFQSPEKKSNVTVSFDHPVRKPMMIREAIGYQIGCFFTHCVKGGRGVKPMCKN